MIRTLINNGKSDNIKIFCYQSNYNELFDIFDENAVYYYNFNDPHREYISSNYQHLYSVFMLFIEDGKICFVYHQLINDDDVKRQENKNGNVNFAFKEFARIFKLNNITTCLMK
jgi:hypothetical protein